jgi:hypothetical protein
MPDVRLIDANALKEWLGCDGDNKYRSMIMHEIADRIDEQPTIDAVPVVRCRECKYARPLVQEEWVACIMWCRGSQSDGFCHMGAKMDGGAEGEG